MLRNVFFRYFFSDHRCKYSKNWDKLKLKVDFSGTLKMIIKNEINVNKHFKKKELNDMSQIILFYSFTQSRVFFLIK